LLENIRLFEEVGQFARSFLLNLDIKVERFARSLFWKGIGQPLEWIYLDAINPDLKMEMRAGHSSGGADLSDQLSSLDVVSD